MRPATVIPRRPPRWLAQEETEVNKRGTYNSSTQTPASASASGVPHQHRRDIGLCRCPVSVRGGGSALTKSDSRSQCHAKPKSQAKELRNSLLLDRQGEQPIASMPREPPIASVRRVHRERLAYPVLEDRRSPKENSSMLIGFGAFQSLGSPRPLRKRLGETWEGFFPGQAGVKGHRKRATWGPNVYFPRACRGKVLFFVCPALSCGLYKGLSGFGSSPKSKGKQSDFNRFDSFSKPGKPEGTSEALGGDLGRPFP